MREASLEAKGEERLAIAGLWTIKMGWEGFPDRMILRKGSDRVFWIEYKTETGVLSALQRVRCRDLVEKGHRVYVVRSLVELDRVIATEATLARPK